MVRPRKNEAERRDFALPRVRVTKAEYEAVSAAAGDAGLLQTEWLRVMIFRRAPKPRAKRLQIVDTRTPAELARQGANLRSLYNDFGRSGKFFPDMTREILANINDAVLSIKRAYDAFYEREFGDDRESDR